MIHCYLNPIWQLNLILQSAYFWGLKATLADLPLKTRKRYLEKIKLLDPVDFIQPKDVFQMNYRKLWEPFYKKMRSCFGRDDESSDKFYPLQKPSLKDKILDRISKSLEDV